MGGFIFMETEGLAAAGAAASGLAGTQGALAGPAAASGAVVPPGLDEISAMNAARIAAHAAQVAAMMAASAAIKENYAASIAASGITCTLQDLMSQAAIAAVGMV